jgi:hypothetical protein
VGTSYNNVRAEAVVLRIDIEIDYLRITNGRWVISTVYCPSFCPLLSFTTKAEPLPVSSTDQAGSSDWVHPIGVHPSAAVASANACRPRPVITYSFKADIGRGDHFLS